MGMAVVNMPGGEILPAAERGTIDCAEWVGGIEDLRLGLHTVWKFHYAPGMHESASVAELAINKDLGQPAGAEQGSHQVGRIGNVPALVGELSEAERGRHRRVRGKTRRQAPDGAARSQQGVSQDLGRVRRGGSCENPFFKKVYESQKAYAAKVVPAKRFMFPPYALQADHYWPVKQ